MCAAFVSALVLTGCAPIELTIIQPTPSSALDDPKEQADAEAIVGDILAENQKPGSKLWERGRARAQDVDRTAAYASHSSVLPGEQVDLFVSTQSKTWRAQAFRIGGYAGKGGRLVWQSEREKGSVQTEQGYLPETRTHFASWKSSLTLDTSQWQPGMYLIRIAGRDKADWLVPLVVRSPDVTDRLVLVMSDLTWQAYNKWGGRSTYEGLNYGREDRSRAVSFSRPYSNGYGTGKYLAYEQPVVQLVEAEGLQVSYVASSDLATNPDLLAGAQGVVFLGHDEYWTVQGRRQVLQARNAGADLAFLGANTMYWRTRYSPDGPQGLPLATVYKSAEEDPISGKETTSRTRDQPEAYNERAIVGQEYECYPAIGNYTVSDPNFFGFAGTGVGAGETVPRILDVEVDRAYPGAPTPKSLQIVALSPTSCEESQTVSTSTYYSHRSGSGVFSTGTMGWVLRGMRAGKTTPERQFTDLVTLTILRAMSEGQMGAEHPSEPNLSEFNLPSFNTTGKA